MRILVGAAFALSLAGAPLAARASAGGPKPARASSAGATHARRPDKSSPATGKRAAGSKSTSRAHAAAEANHNPTIELVHLSTHERFALRPDAKGRFGAKQLHGFRHFLRCHHTGREHAMEPRLAELLYRTARHFDDRTVEVVAGYRAPKVARKKGNPKSPHKGGRACDFRIAGVDVPTLRDYVRTFDKVGVGYYPVSGFVHLDVGRTKRAFWIDYSGPGEMARYSNDPDGDLRAGLAEPGSSGRAPSLADDDDPQSPAPSQMAEDPAPALDASGRPVEPRATVQRAQTVPSETPSAAPPAAAAPALDERPASDGRSGDSAPPPVAP